jgi:hypothetical protein
MSANTTNGLRQPREPKPVFPFDVGLSHLAIDGVENPAWLTSLIETARRDFRPRDLAERSLCDEIAMVIWRRLRVYNMERAIYERQHRTYRPYAAAPGLPAPNLADYYHFAQALSPACEGLVLKALSNLEARLHRQFCSALRMLITLRRANPLRHPDLTSAKDTKRWNSSTTTPTTATRSKTISDRATPPKSNDSEPPSHP